VFFSRANMETTGTYCCCCQQNSPIHTIEHPPSSAVLCRWQTPTWNLWQMTTRPKPMVSPVYITSTRAIFSNHTLIASRGITPKESEGSWIDNIRRQQLNGTVGVDLHISRVGKEFRTFLKSGMEHAGNFTSYGKDTPSWASAQVEKLTGKCALFYDPPPTHTHTQHTTNNKHTHAHTHTQS